MSRTVDRQRRIALQAARAAADALSADVFLLASPIISRSMARRLVEEHAKTERREKCVLAVLRTQGGDPDSAYIISSYLRECYGDGFTALVSGPCKSAGTLLVLGARRVVMGRQGELGPLDMQVSKKDELFDSESGLELFTSLDILTSTGVATFLHHLFEIQLETQISTRLAADIAAKLTSGVIEPIARRIDPIGLGRRPESDECRHSVWETAGGSGTAAGETRSQLPGSRIRNRFS